MICELSSAQSFIILWKTGEPYCFDQVRLKAGEVLHSSIYLAYTSDLD